MKKTIKIILSVMTLAIFLSACTAKDLSSGDDRKRPEREADPEGKERESGSDVSENEADTVDGTGYVLYDSTYGNIVYVIDAADRQLVRYDLTQIEDRLHQNGYGSQSFWFQAADADRLYYEQYNTKQSGGTYSVYAVDPANADMEMIWESDENWYINSVDRYQDKLYITEYKYNDNSSGLTYKEFVYQLSNDSGKITYEPKGTCLDTLFHTAADTGYRPMSRSSYGYGTQCSFTQTLAENGFILASANSSSGTYVLISEDGTISSLPKLKADGDNNPYINGYDKNYILYGVSNDDYTRTDYYCIDIATGEVNDIPQGEKGFQFLAFRDGAAYFAEDVSEEYGINKNNVYQYQCADKALKQLYTAQTIPGTDGLISGMSNFQLIDGRLYALSLNGDTVEWSTLKTQDGKAEMSGIECPLKELNTLKYGTVSYISDIVLCPYCGTPLSKDYNEIFVLSAKYSSYADQINKVIYDRFSEGDHNLGEEGSDVQYNEEECENHLEYPMQWCTTVDDYISNVRIINDNYLVVDRSGYWYGGGAHGYPMREQLLFDLTSGEQKTLKDFYTGSEEDFKRLIAQKTKEDFETYDEENCPYFSQDAESVYNDAYESASLENTYIEFNEDGAFIVYFPYDMGSYAAGFIEVPVSYEELLGRKSL